MKPLLNPLVVGVGLLVAGIVSGSILTLASLFIVRPIACSTDTTDPACIYDGGDAIVAWRGFPFGITENPREQSQDCSIMGDCYAYYHSNGAIGDVCVWTLVSYGMIGLYVVGLRKGER